MDSITLTKKQFNDLKNLVYSVSGINLHDGKMELLKSKLAKRMRMTKKSYHEYLDYLNTNKQEIVEFIDTVTTNHSFFYRENKSIEHIITTFLNHHSKQTKTFKIWCAACSTGDEPYSLAVQLKENGIGFTILATDISHSVLSTASKGIYKNDKVKNVPRTVLHRFFQKGSGKYNGYVKIKKDVMHHIQFRELNLITDPLPDDSFDAVLCRNVMIYFDVATSENVVNRLYSVIKPNGFFAIGNAESLINLKHKFQSVRKVPSLYKK